MRIHKVNREKSWECQGIPKLQSLHTVRDYSRLDGHSIAVRDSHAFASNVCKKTANIV